MDMVRRKLIGHYNYYGITDNSRQLSKFQYEILKTLCKWLNRRSQKRSYTQEKFLKMIKSFNLPYPTIKVNIYDILIN